MISVARIAMCKAVAAAHSRGLLRNVFVVGVSSNALKKTSFSVVGARRMVFAGFPVAPAWAGSKRCIGCVVIVSPFLPFDRRKSFALFALPTASMSSSLVQSHA